MNDSLDLTLRDVALRASDRLGGARGRALDRAAKQRGLTLSYTTIDKIIAGTYLSRPRRETLDALVELSGYSREEVHRAAGEPLPLKPFAEQLPPDVDILSADQRAAVLGVVRQFVAVNRERVEEVGGRDAASGTAPIAVTVSEVSSERFQPPQPPDE